MPTPEKETAIEALAEKMRRAKLLVVTDYRGLSVRDLAALRRQLRPLQTDYVVAKNTLLRIAARQNDVAAADDLLAGPTAVAFCYDDIVGASRALTDFVRTSRILRVRGGVLDGSVIAADEISRLATLPPLEQLRAQVVAAIGGPLAAVVGVLNGVLQSVVGTLEARVEQQGGVEAAPAASTEGGVEAAPAASTEGGVEAAPAASTEGGVEAAPAASTEGAEEANG